MTLFLLSCSLGRALTAPAPASPPPPAATATPLPPATPSPLPFQSYGQTLRDVTYCTPGDLPQKMDLYFPQAGGPWPVLAYVHGGSWMRGDKSEAAALAPGLTARGYLVVSINYRLYPVGEFPDMVEDVKCAVRSLRANASQYNLDPNRIAAIGVSAGGHLVSLLGTADESAGWEVGEHLDRSSRVRAVIAMAAPTDLTRRFPNADMELMRYVGTGKVDLVRASPITHVTADDPPFLLIHGDRDRTVPYEQSQLMYERLIQTGVPARLVTVQNGDHSFSAAGGATTPSLGEINQTIMDFLAKYLQ